MTISAHALHTADLALISLLSAVGNGSGDSSVRSVRGNSADDFKGRHNDSAIGRSNVDTAGIHAPVTFAVGVEDNLGAIM